MNNTPDPFGLHCPDGREAQLLSVQVQGEILGLMLRLTVRQTWRNTSGAPMATRLRFPLGADQTLLDLRLEGAHGTQPLTLVARDSRTCCSATPGVLATGEQVTLQWRIGQLLHLQGSSLRLQLPAALLPRAPRPAQIGFEVHDPVALGTVGSPSHELQRVRHANGIRLSLRAPTGLDKDLVLTVHGLRDTGFALASPDPSAPGACTVLMSCSPRLQQAAPSAGPLRMKLLVDSSSAMPAERLAPIRTALDKLLAQLTPQDQLSYSRFGERSVHDLPRLQVCTEAYQKRLRALARHTDTDLGAPAPLAALQAVLALTDEDEEAVPDADLLLITASPLWHIEAPLRDLQAAGHRLHVMALSSAGQSLWRELAEASGGAFEWLAPGQHSQQTLTRLIERMRHLRTVRARLQVDHATVLSGGERTQCMADGDTLHLWAQIQADAAPQDLTGRPELSAALHWIGEGTPQTPTPTPVLWDAQGDLTRLCAAQDALRLDGDALAQHLARHGLTVPDCTRLAATSTPAAAPEASAQATSPSPQRPKVLPSAPSLRAPLPAPAAVPPSPQSVATATTIAAVTAHAPVRSLRGTPPRHADLAGWLSEPHAPGNPLTTLVQGFNAHAGAYGQFRAALSSSLREVSTRLLDGLVLQLMRRAGNPGRVWALLLYWLHTEHELALHAQALQLVEQELASLPVALRNELTAALAHAVQTPVARHAA